MEPSRFTRMRVFLYIQVGLLLFLTGLFVGQWRQPSSPVTVPPPPTVAPDTDAEQSALHRLALRSTLDSLGRNLARLITQRAAIAQRLLETEIAINLLRKRGEGGGSESLQRLSARRTTLLADLQHHDRIIQEAQTVAQGLRGETDALMPRTSEHDDEQWLHEARSLLLRLEHRRSRDTIPDHAWTEYQRTPATPPDDI